MAKKNSPPNLLPLAAGLGGTAVLAFTLGALTATWWLQPDQPRLAARSAATLPVPRAAPKLPAITPPTRPALPKLPAQPARVTLPAQPARVTLPARAALPPATIDPLVLAAADSLSLPPPQPEYAVQLGAFVDIDNAQAFQRDLAMRGMLTRVVRWSGRDGRVWFAARLDGFYPQDEAQTAAAALARQGFDTMVVREAAGEQS